MAWTALTFAFKSVLTSAKMTQLFDNFAAMANADSGAPAINLDTIGLNGSFTTASLAAGATETQTITHGLGTDNVKVAIRGNHSEGNSSEWACTAIFRGGSYVYFTGDGIGNMQGGQPSAPSTGDITIIVKNTGSSARAVTIYYSILRES